MKMQENVSVSLTTQESTVRKVSFGVVHGNTSISCCLSTKDLNPCAHLSPCKNGGNCSIENVNQYSCACPSGYTGMDCEEDVDECKMSPCANQATCIVSDHTTHAHKKGLSGYEFRDLFLSKEPPRELPVFVCARLDRRAL